ncbi:MAG: methyltransferase domain-containing protein [Chlamydiales bacterium]|nr:methyltransferase domain-containing protein [Chlamydiales bacterium]
MSIRAVDRSPEIIVVEEQSQPVSLPDSPFRIVFGSEELRGEFVHFLQTIFYQLDEEKVLKKMDEILADPNKSDEQIYKELAQQIDGMRKTLPSLFYQLKSLWVLQQGMGLQAAQLLRGFRPEEFHNYLEVYFRRYLNTIRKTAKLPLDGNILDVSDEPYQGSVKEKLEAGAFFSSYPYRNSVSLNDADCTNPKEEPEKTHKPIGEEVEDNGTDLLVCLGGLHHIPSKRVDGFVHSMSQKIRPGGVLLLRDHDVTSVGLHAMVSVVHSFVNATSREPWEVERKEVREFHSADHWTELLKRHQFIKISPDCLVLENDPTQNGMMVFVKEPTNLEELQIASRYRKDCVRPVDGTRATWIEWGNVRYAKQFAEFIQTRHWYAFDYMGHLKQHWQYFTHYLKGARKDLSLGQIIFSDNFAMNVFILASMIFQCGSRQLASLPSMLVARLTQGAQWREALDLTALEKYEARVEEEYSEFIDDTPFYAFPYLSKIKGLWTTIWNANESRWTKCTSAMSAASSTLSLLAKTAICAPIKKMYMQEGQCIEPDRVAIIIEDPLDQFWSPGKYVIGNQECHVKTIYETSDKGKLISVSRYRPFTEMCKKICDSGKRMLLLEIGGQRKITVDVVYQSDQATFAPSSEVNAKLLYEMDRLQDPEQRRYATYEVDVKDLINFGRIVGSEKIEYIHE